MKNMKTLLALALTLAASATAASAAVVYLPVQYQYGLHGEIFYGGTNPDFLGNPYVFVPGAPLNATANPGSNGVDGARAAPQALGQLSQRFNGASPSYRYQRFDARGTELPRLFYSDLNPYTEVGQYGFTADDARNEAYLNVPTYQVKGNPPGGPAPIAETVAPADPRLKAIPLLNWARNANARGETPLVKSLLQEANKWDPAATARMRDELHLDK